MICWAPDCDDDRTMHAIAHDAQTPEALCGAIVCGDTGDWWGFKPHQDVCRMCEGLA